MSWQWASTHASLYGPWCLTWVGTTGVLAGGTAAPRRHRHSADVDVAVVLVAHHHVHEHPVGGAGARGSTPSASGPRRGYKPTLPAPQPPCLPPVSLETKHDDLGSVARPLTHSQVQVTVDLLILEEPYLPDLSSTLSQSEAKQGYPSSKLEKSSHHKWPGQA